MATEAPPCLALTMGDPSGIGPEITVKAWLARHAHRTPPFVYVGNAEHIKGIIDHLSLRATVDDVTTCTEAVDVFDDHLPVLNCVHSERVEWGRPSRHHVNSIVQSLNTAIALTRDGSASALVTNPVHKKTMWQGGFAFPGHTEYLAAKTSAGNTKNDAVMMLTVPGLRVVPVTVHVPLSRVSGSLRTEDIIRAGSVTNDALITDFGIERPKLGIAALNPHAGEEADLGTEEQEVIGPAVNALCKAGLDAAGPYPADTLFAEHSRKRFDAIICMYHDQALIPLKTIDFHLGVNVTLGLPIVRTSPDHGTAHDLAGKGFANPASLIMALNMAHDIAQERTRHE